MFKGFIVVVYFGFVLAVMVDGSMGVLFGRKSLASIKKLTLWNLMKSTVISSLKNDCWAWIAIDRQTKQVLGFVCGIRYQDL